MLKDIIIALENRYKPIIYIFHFNSYTLVITEFLDTLACFIINFVAIHWNMI